MRFSKLAAFRRAGGLRVPATGLALCWGAVALAQNPPRDAAGSTPFERYVPEDAGVFVSVQRLDEIAETLSKTHADRILALLTGAEVGQFPSFDARTLVAAFSGSAAKIEGDDLSSSGFGLAAASWQSLLDGVLFVRTPAASNIERWFPQGRLARISPSTRIVRVEEQIVACARDEVVAIARRSDAGTLMRETLRLMAGRTAEAIGKSEQFRELSHYLPARPMALAYVSLPHGTGGMAGPSEADARVERDAGSLLKDAVIGMYNRAGRLDFALRGVRRFPADRRPVSEFALAHIKSLPASTVFVWLGVHDLQAALRGDVDSGDVPGRYARLLAGFRRQNGEPEPFPPLGSHLILALDRDALAERQTPQIVAMMDTPEPRAVAQEFTDAVNAFLDLLYNVDTVDEDDAPVIRVWNHGEIPVSTVALDRYGSASRFRGAALVRSLSPSWAATAEWFVVTTTKEEMARVLDAMSGTGPTLGDSPHMQAVFDQAAERNSVAFVQGSALADLLVRWLRDAERGYPSILNRSLMAKGALASGPRPEELGVTLREPTSAGQAVVEEVVPGSSAHGQLHPEDRILAIDGTVLNLSLPNEDLRRRLASTTTDRRTLRVLRQDEVVEVTLTTPPVAVDLPALPLDAGAATREVALILREIEFASFVELQTPPEHYAALVSVRFVPGPGPAVVPAPAVVETTVPDQVD